MVSLDRGWYFYANANGSGVLARRKLYDPESGTFSAATQYVADRSLTQATTNHGQGVITGGFDGEFHLLRLHGGLPRNYTIHRGSFSATETLAAGGGGGCRYPGNSGAERKKC